jgi:hypothetical protein
VGFAGFACGKEADARVRFSGKAARFFCFSLGRRKIHSAAASVRCLLKVNRAMTALSRMGYARSGANRREC